MLNIKLEEIIEELEWYFNEVLLSNDKRFVYGLIDKFENENENENEVANGQ